MTFSEEFKTANRTTPRTPPSRPIARLMLCLLAALLVQTSNVQAQEESAVEEAAPSQASVLAQFTTGIEDREPIDQITFVGNSVKKIFFFSDLRGLTGQTVQHRWIYDGKVVARVNFEVRGPRWRVWSSKELLPDWIGDWTVEIVAAEKGESGDGQDAGEADGEVIAAETFTYSAPDA